MKNFVLLALLITSLFSGCIAEKAVKVPSPVLASPEPEVTSEMKEIVGVPNETIKVASALKSDMIDLGSVI